MADALGQGLKRPDHVLARSGGEEFAVMLSQADAAGAVVAAERLRTGIENLGILHPSSPVADCVTVSQGLAWVLPERRGSPSVLVALADAALYGAKESGRNRICDTPSLSVFVARQSHNRTPHR